ncbi:Protein arv1 like protein [Nosema granulosis]|uniref:Protein ARV n=1 Tax=Nosema granulosis TaxID=83296 RepID=A0A9P6H3K4_9MICR|nr:Protein arv1 like protein [Nosema granulosis]
MFICIECGEKNKILFSSKQTVLSCKSCLKKMDKYFEVNDTLLFIDILLLKKEVFRHLIFNRKPTKIIPFYFLSRIAFLARYHFLFSNNLKFVYLIYFLILSQSFEIVSTYVLFLVCKNKIQIGLLWNTIVQTSFYYLFVFVMIVWGYSEIEYYILVEFLVLLSNAIGLSCVTDNSIEAMFSFLSAFKALNYLICSYLLNK